MLPDFRSPDWQKARTDEELRQVIAQGRGMMPGFARQITEEGVTQLIAHVRRFAPGKP